MREIIHNNDNLREEDITETVIRAKALIVTNGNILIGNENNFFEFPGGHLEDNETVDECLKREILEETGIELDDSEIKGVITKVVFMTKDWPEVGKNRKAETYFCRVQLVKYLHL